MRLPGFARTFDGATSSQSIAGRNGGRSRLQNSFTAEAMEMLFRSSRGVLRVASKTLRAAIRMAAERGQSFLDEAAVQAALDDIGGAT